jgi:hypothetical protein
VRIESILPGNLNVAVDGSKGIAHNCAAESAQPFQAVLDGTPLADDPLGFTYVATVPEGGQGLPALSLPLSGHILLGQAVQQGGGWPTGGVGILESGTVTLRVIPVFSDERVTLNTEHLDEGSLLDTHACLESKREAETTCPLRDAPPALGFLRTLAKGGLSAQIYARGPVGVQAFSGASQYLITIPNSVATWRSEGLRYWVVFLSMLAGFWKYVSEFFGFLKRVWQEARGVEPHAEDERDHNQPEDARQELPVEEEDARLRSEERKRNAEWTSGVMALIFVLGGIALGFDPIVAYAEPVEIRQGDVIGAGYSFHRGATCLVITAYHVVKEIGVPVTVIDRTGAKAAGNRSYANESYDLAQIELPDNSSVACTSTWPDVAWLRSANLSASSELRAVRHYAGGQEVIIRLKYAGGDKDHIMLAPVDKLTIRASDSGAIVELDGRLVGIVLSVDAGTDRVRALRFNRIDELVGDRFGTASVGRAPVSDPPREDSRLEQLRSRSLILGFDGAMAVAHALMGRNINQEVDQLNAYLKPLNLTDVSYPRDPLGANKKADPFAAFAGKVMAQLGAVDRRLQLAFAIGWAGVFTTNTPALKPAGFDLRKLAQEAGLPPRPEMTDPNYVQWLADEARKSVSVGRTPPTVASPAPVTQQAPLGNFECYASTKDTMMETLKVQAPSEDVARQTVLRHLGARSFGLATIRCSKP